MLLPRATALNPPPSYIHTCMAEHAPSPHQPRGEAEQDIALQYCTSTNGYLRFEGCPGRMRMCGYPPWSFSCMAGGSSGSSSGSSIIVTIPRTHPHACATWQSIPRPCTSMEGRGRERHIDPSACRRASTHAYVEHLQPNSEEAGERGGRKRQCTSPWAMRALVSRELGVATCTG
ncbi:hypothetical protein K431DRAFT_115344 [Polychaeton citri CBS 116435]|uniref:Uncharacterized protein n=1 Tax=Polychaeton citri CBS 116435 TaxID=1314669 RepID=A0A9P4QFL2_9PEZI|nr:hypothetical protein K431DRAFT_115344 [Polychaeton citri CBS 116435]